VDTDSATPDELLAACRLTRALEILESRVGARPQDFDSWLKLVEVHAAYCRDFPRAGRIVDKITANPAFSAEQVREAKAKLKDWRALRAS